MSLEFRNKVIGLSNAQLINLLKNNNYHFEKVLTKKTITGKEFLELKETDFATWGISLNEKKKLWHCVTELSNNPQEFFFKHKAIELEKITIGNTCQKSEFKKKLELVFTAQSPNSSSNQDKVLPNPPAVSPPLPDYIAIDKTLFYEDGYLLPNENIIRNHYKDTYFPSKTTDIFQKKSLALPRRTTDDGVYILGPEKPSIVDIEDIYEEVRVQEDISKKKTKDSNFKINLGVSSASAKESKIQNRSLPKIPLLMSCSSGDDGSSLDEEVYMNNRSGPGKLSRSGTRMHISNKMSSLVVPKSGRPFEKMFSCSNRRGGEGCDYHTLNVPKPIQLLRPPNALPKTLFQLPQFFFDFGNQEFIDDLHHEPYFRNTDRNGATKLLHGLPNGAFLLRKSCNCYIVLTLKYNEECINLQINKMSNGFLKLYGEDDSSPDFVNLSHLINYFTMSPIGFTLNSGKTGQTLLKKVLPANRF